MQPNLKIGVFDSGIGGTTVLAEIKKLLPRAEYFYLADSKNCPYGTKTDAELQEIVTKNVENLLSRGATIIVVACNTATTRCIDFLRKKFPKITFIGTEPAIKLAADSGAKKILVLATPGTIDSSRTKDLIQTYAREGQQIDLLPCPGLADAIEHNLTSNPAAITAKLTELLAGTPKDYGTVVLGCTHYPLVKSEIAQFFPSATLLDGAPGVARAVKAAASAQNVL